MNVDILTKKFLLRPMLSVMFLQFPDLNQVSLNIFFSTPNASPLWIVDN